MAKTPKVKKREVSLHSRAARRGAASPPPKDLAVKKAQAEETEYKPWMHTAQNAGIHKRQKKAKPLSRQQKLRQQRGLEHAERNIDKLEKKVADSKGRGKKIQARSREWEDLNETIVGKENVDAEKQVSEQVAKETKEDGAKEMEGVEMPDLEQPLPIRLAEAGAEGPEATGETATGVKDNQVVDRNELADNLAGVT